MDSVKSQQEGHAKGMERQKASSGFLDWRENDFPRLIKAVTPYLLLLPAVALVGVLLVIPLVRTIVFSFYSFPFGDVAARTPVGFGNYKELFASSGFRNSMRFTVLFSVITIILELVLAFAFAFALDSIRRGRALLTTIAVMPFMVASIAVGLIWRLMYARDGGLINYGLSILGVAEINWLGLPQPAMWAAIMAEVWATMPFVMLILLAGLTSIPLEVLQAGRADGATGLRLFRYIILPLLLPSFTVALVFQTVFKVRVFDLVFILTEGGPGGLTSPLGLLIYRQYFQFNQSGLASASSVFLLLFGAIICVVYVKLLYREVEY